MNSRRDLVQALVRPVRRPVIDLPVDPPSQAWPASAIWDDTATWNDASNWKDS